MPPYYGTWLELRVYRLSELKGFGVVLEQPKLVLVEGFGVILGRGAVATANFQPSWRLERRSSSQSH